MHGFGLHARAEVCSGAAGQLRVNALGVLVVVGGQRETQARRLAARQCGRTAK